MSAGREDAGPDFTDRSASGLASIFRHFATEEAPQLDSPLYAELCAGIAEDEELLAIASLAPRSQPPPNLLLAAAHFLLLRGAVHPLAAHYPDLSDSPVPPESALPAFRDFCLAHRTEVEMLVATRMTQTNVLRRCTCLLPAFATLAADAPGRPLALLEIGPSAGLNLNWDRYHYDYGEGRIWGNPESPVRLTAEVRGAVPLPLLPDPLDVVWKVGVDLRPIALGDDDAVTWLRALIWPEHVDRHERLAAAIELAREHAPPVVAGDAAERLPELLEQAPDAATLCVYGTHTLYQFPEDARRAVYGALQQHARRRLVTFVSMEGTGVRCSELRRFTYTGDRRSVTKLADCSPHGWWLEWMPPDVS